MANVWYATGSKVRCVVCHLMCYKILCDDCRTPTYYHIKDEEDGDYESSDSEDETNGWTIWWKSNCGEGDFEYCSVCEGRYCIKCIHFKADGPIEDPESYLSCCNNCYNSGAYQEFLHDYLKG